jgi:ParB family chromosome partitioning protein
MQSKKRGLGKGLAALLPPKATPGVARDEPGTATDEVPGADTEPVEGLRQVRIDALSPNPYQPRTEFSDETLRELAASIHEHGFIQPIAVTRRNDNLIIVAGERRWRAARLAGIQTIPIIELKLGDREVLEFALVENLQREDLNPIDEARAYHALMNTFGLTQEQVAEHLGKGRPTVANALRLLSLPAGFQKDIEEGNLSPGHARALLSLDVSQDRQTLRDAIVRDGLSVREAERLAVDITTRKRRLRQRTRQKPLDAESQRLQDLLIEKLTCRVRVKPIDGNRGKIEIHYDTLDELDRILAELGIDT